MTTATIDGPLPWPRGYHTLSPNLSCVDCQQEWPCPPYQATLRRVYGPDTPGMTAFMTSLLPAANRAALHLSAQQVQDRLVGWCTTGTPESPAPPTVAGRPLPHARRVPPPPPRRPATPTPHNGTPPRSGRILSGAAS